MARHRQVRYIRKEQQDRFINCCPYEKTLSDAVSVFGSDAMIVQSGLRYYNVTDYPHIYNAAKSRNQ